MRINLEANLKIKLSCKLYSEQVLFAGIKKSKIVLRRDASKGDLRKDQASLAGNGQQKMPQLGHTWDRLEYFLIRTY